MWAKSSANVYNANSAVIREFVTTSKSACDRFFIGLILNLIKNEANNGSEK